MNWNTSIRIKDEKETEHMLEVATSRPAGEAGVVDISVTEIDADGNKINSWNMRYDLLNNIFIFPNKTKFNKNIIKEMQTIVNTGAESW